LKRDPNNVNALDWKGILQGSKGNYKEGIPYFDKGLDLDPNNVCILRNKAFGLEKIGDIENADQCYQQANVLERGTLE
jgi:Flp pilus assembly protein TadD